MKGPVATDFRPAKRLAPSRHGPHKLNVKVIPEGVETVLQKRLLTETGCDFGQGFYFSEPLTADDFENMLREAAPFDTGD